MVCKNEIDSREQLLETLIRMVGCTNQTIQSLQKRVTQLECLLREQHLNTRKEFLLKPETDLIQSNHSTSITAKNSFIQNL